VKIISIDFLKKYFHKSTNISFLNKYIFIKKSKSKLCFEDRVTVKNRLLTPIHQYEGSILKISTKFVEQSQLISSSDRACADYRPTRPSKLMVVDPCVRRGLFTTCLFFSHSIKNDNFFLPSIRSYGNLKPMSLFLI
jgi:hypothetical protein